MKNAELALERADLALKSVDLVVNRSQFGLELCDLLFDNWRNYG